MVWADILQNRAKRNLTSLKRSLLVLFFLLLRNCKDHLTVCQHCRQWPKTFYHHCQTRTNCLPGLPKTNQLFANHLTLKTSNYLFEGVFKPTLFLSRFLVILPQIFFDLKKVSERKCATFISRQPDNSQMLETASLLIYWNF